LPLAAALYGIGCIHAKGGASVSSKQREAKPFQPESAFHRRGNVTLALGSDPMPLALTTSAVSHDSHRRTDMFESAELGRTLSKGEYERRLPGLRAKLIKAGFALKQARIPVIIIISGVDGAGKGEVVHRLNEWFDTRALDTHAFWHETEEEREHPYYWHFWQALPARGRIGLLFGSWYTRPVSQRLSGKLKNGALDATLQRITFFEEMLANDGALIIKLWFHLSEKALRKRLSSLRRNPETHWRVLPADLAQRRIYDKFIRVSERALRETDSPHAPWHLIESADSRYRDVTAAQIILDAIQRRLGESTRSKKTRTAPQRRLRITPEGGKTVLDRVDLHQSLSGDAYEEKLTKYQAKLSQLVWAAYEKKIPTVIVFEGWDAAGKGSCIRRVTSAMDPRLFRVVPIGAPTEEERAHHYLWRFWRHLPADGLVTIFDRSWYGRVLVERVEGFAQPAEWMRAYRELNMFEEHLTDHGTVLAKFWIHISKEEQLRRFKEREAVPFKRYKITAEDWRNRDKWDAHKAAVNDMVGHTSTGFAPWVIVAGNSKRFARIQILKRLCQQLEEAL
jgi:polyphosphate:AMP phosphotransferase